MLDTVWNGLVLVGTLVVESPLASAAGSKRFRAIADAILKLPAASCVLDAEAVACDESGNPDFYQLMRGAPHGWCACALT